MGNTIPNDIITEITNLDGTHSTQVPDITRSNIKSKQVFSSIFSRFINHSINTCFSCNLTLVDTPSPWEGFASCYLKLVHTPWLWKGFVHCNLKLVDTPCPWKGFASCNLKLVDNPCPWAGHSSCNLKLVDTSCLWKGFASCI